MTFWEKLRRTSNGFQSKVRQDSEAQKALARAIRFGKERVRRMMEQHGIKARGKRKFVVTTDSKHKLPIAANLVQRNITAAATNKVWTGDITHIATLRGLAVSGDGCTAHGVVPACGRKMRDLSLRQVQSILRL